MTSIDVIGRRTDWACDIMPVQEWLSSLPAGKVNMWGSSPPYFGLRSYLPNGHPLKVFEIGTEETPEEYVDKLVTIFGEAHRATHDTGVFFLNLGDSYAQQGGNGRQGATSQRIGRSNVDAQQKPRSQNPAPGYKAKDLYGVPWMVAFAMREAGWYLRQWMPWVKWNPMAESVEDRPGSACESIFLLSKSSDYYYDHIAVRRPDAGYDMGNRNGYSRDERVGKESGGQVNFVAGSGRNFRNNDLWFDTAAMLFNDDGDPLGLHSGVGNFKGAHFASFPREVIEPLILCGSSDRGVCPTCGRPWERQVETERVSTRPGCETKVVGNEGLTSGNRDPGRHITKYKTAGWEPSCKCERKPPVPAIVGDMFAGTGTTLAVAREHGRVAIGCDIDTRNLEFVQKRMANTQPTLASAFLGDTLE